MGSVVMVLGRNRRFGQHGSVLVAMVLVVFVFVVAVAVVASMAVEAIILGVAPLV